MYTRPYWNMVKSFLEKVLSINNIRHIDKLIIFNTIRDELVPTAACAFIRHAFNHFYRDFAMVDTHDEKFVWQSTLNRAMKGFRNAVLAYGESIKSFLANRTHTTQKKRVPDEALTHFNKLITFTNEGRQYSLTSAFQDAIEATAKLESDNYAPAQG
jgi:hypothetical protein